MYKNSIVLSLEQLAKIAVVKNTGSVSIVNSNTYDTQTVSITTITIPPVSTRLLTKYPLCKNFIMEEPIILNVYPLSVNDVSIVTANKNYNLVTDISTSHVPRIDQLTGIVSKLPSSPDKVSNKEDIPRCKTSNSSPATYEPGGSNHDVIISNPPVEFSSRTYRLVSQDALYQTVSKTSVLELTSQYCDTDNKLITDSMIFGDLSKSSLMFKSSSEIFEVLGNNWDVPVNNINITNGLRVEYNPSTNADLLFVFIKRDSREFT
jgi:hypothetical protein